MPKKFPKAVKERAFKLYLTDDYSAREIAEQISAEHRVVVNEQTIYAWVRQYDWKTKKQRLKLKQLKKYKRMNQQNLQKCKMNIKPSIKVLEIKLDQSYKY